jgi:hypothetical protein
MAHAKGYKDDVSKGKDPEKEGYTFEKHTLLSSRKPSATPPTRLTSLK